MDQRSGVDGAGAVGWLNRKIFEDTGDEVKSQGWSPFILDTNGNGKRDDGYVEPNQPVDPTKDKRIAADLYWRRRQPGRRHRCGARVLGYPRPQSSGSRPGSDPHAHGADGSLRAAVRRATGRAAATSTATASSGRRSRADISASFDRSKCKVRSTDRPRPASIARRAGRCITFPGPQFKDVTGRGQRRGELLHLGRSVQHASGSARTCRSRPATRTIAARAGQWRVVNLRVPYPMGFFAKWMDGRIDDPDAGWKGRGLWATIARAHCSTSKAARQAAEGGEVPAAAGSAGEMSGHGQPCSQGWLVPPEARDISDRQHLCAGEAARHARSEEGTGDRAC